MGAQLDMFGAPAGAPPADRAKATEPEPEHELTIDQRFEAFHAENPHVLDEMLKLARKELAKGTRRIGAKALWEDLRSWLKTTGQPYKLNNSYTALYARKLVEIEPALDGVIEFRRRKS